MAFNQDIADVICEMLASGQTLRAVCRTLGTVDASTVLAWAQGRHGAPEAFSKQYAHARELGYQVMADEVLEIADGEAVEDVNPVTGERALIKCDPARDRLRFDARRWLLSKALPKIYGDKLAVDANVKAGVTVLKATPEDESL